jgi:hypothetical protein
VPDGFIYLEIADERSSTNWIWRLFDEKGLIEAEATISPVDLRVQSLLDRDALDLIAGPVSVREDLTRAATLLLTEPIAERLKASRAPGLLVAGPPSARLALSLPYELLFGGRDPSRVVVRQVSHRGIGRARSEVESVFSAFSLLTEDPYLPLHDEAAMLAELCESLDIPLEELFVCFTAEHLAERSRGATIVHLAGHGQRGIWRCVGGDHSSRVVASRDLITAWAEAPPRLVVLNFCESSSERESSDLVSAMHRGGIAQWQHESQTRQGVPEYSTSMALDLASALPVAVLALRSPIDDYEARKLVHTFYRLHLRDGLSLVDAYSKTLAEVPSYDDFGMPTPVLYLGGAPGLLPQKLPSNAGAEQVCLSRRHRQCVNLYHQTLSVLSPVVEGSWNCLIDGNEPAVGDLVEDALRELVELPYLQRRPGQPQAIETSRSAHGRLFEHKRGSEAASVVTSIAADQLAEGVVEAELFSACPGVSRDALFALEVAIRDLPSLLFAVLRSDIEQLANAAHNELAGRNVLLERPSVWDLTNSLLRSLPDTESGPISNWADERWQAAIARGPSAIDLIAAWHLHADNWFLAVDMQSVSAALSGRTNVPVAEIYDMAVSLRKDGVLGFGSALFAGDMPPHIGTDELTSARAWAVCSKAAAVAHVESMISRSQDPSGTFDSMPLDVIAYLATMAHIAGDARHKRLEDAWERQVGVPLGLASTPTWDGVATDDPEYVFDGHPRHEHGHAFLDLRFSTAEGRLPEVAGKGPYRDPPLEDDERSFYGQSEWRLASALGDEDLPAAEIIREAVRLDSLVLAQLDGIVREGREQHHAPLIFDRLCGLRRMLADALVELGQRAVAIEVMHSLFTRVRQTRVDPLTLAVTGFAAVSLMRREDALREARAICDELQMPIELRGSPAVIVALIAELELLGAEQRLTSLKPAARALLSEVAAWREPTERVARRAITIGALYGLDRLMEIDAEHFVICVLMQITNDITRFGVAELDGVLGSWATSVSANDVTAAVKSIVPKFERVLGVLGVTPDVLRERSLAYREQIVKEPVHPSAAGIAPLRPRAEAGCWLTSRILARLTGSEAPTEPPDGFFEAMPAIAETAPRIQDVCPAFYNESVRVLLPPLVRAFGGDIESRFLLVGLMADELHPDRASPKLYALFALAHGNFETALAIAGEVTAPAELAEIGILIEGVALGEPGLQNATPTTTEITDLSIERWRLIITADPSDPLRVGLSSLGLQVAAGQHIVPLLQDATSKGVSTAELVDLPDDAPVARAVLTLLDATPNAQIVLATLELTMGSVTRETVTRFLEPFRKHDDKLVACRGWETLLVAHMERGDREEAERDLDEILESVQRDGRGDDPALSAVLVNLREMVERGWSDLVLPVGTRIDQRLAGRLNGFELWYLAAGRFAALISLDRKEEAAARLRDVGMRLGLPAACAVLLSGGIADFGDPTTAGLTSVILSLKDVKEPKGAPAEWRQAGRLLANKLVGAEHWQDVHKLLMEAFG